MINKFSIFLKMTNGMENHEAEPLNLECLSHQPKITGKHQYIKQRHKPLGNFNCYFTE